jgi:hypothetical protein
VIELDDDAPGAAGLIERDLESIDRGDAEGCRGAERERAEGDAQRATNAAVRDQPEHRLARRGQAIGAPRENPLRKTGRPSAVRNIARRAG